MDKTAPPDTIARLRVLHVVQRFYPELGGTETHVAEVGARLVQRGVDLTVLATDRTGALPRRERHPDGYLIMRRRSYPPSRDYYVSPGIVGVIREGPWDLVHFQGVHTAVPPIGMSAALSAGIPYLLTFHSGGHSSPIRSRMRGLQWRALTPLLSRACALVAVSRFEAGRFAEATGIPRDRFTVIQNGGALPPAPGVTAVPGRILSSGRLERYKGHHHAIRALAVLRRTQPEAHLVILGHGPCEAELRALASSEGVADAVEIRFLDPSDRAGMAREVASASVMAAFSDYEAHPVAVMEALTLGVPVVGFDVAGTGDLVEDGLVTGLPPGSSAQTMAAALDRAMGAGSSEAGVRASLPTWETCTDALVGVYHDVAAAGSSRP